jgi:hypothetical protein
MVPRSVQTPARPRPGPIATTAVATHAALATQRARPQLPMSVKNGLAASIDWNLTILVALSFLFHFGFIGALYSDWSDPVVAEDITTGGLIDMVASLPAAPVEPMVDRAQGPSPPSAPARVTPEPPAHARGRLPERDAAAAAATERSQAVVLREAAGQIEALRFGLLGAGRSTTALEGVLRRDDLPTVDLTGAAPADVGAARATTGDLHLTTSDRVVRPGAVMGLGVLATTHARSDQGGREVVTGGPRSDAVVETCTLSVPVLHADSVIAGLRPAFRACYNRGLADDSGMSGKVTVVAQIAPNGEVSGTRIESNTGLSAKVIDCLERRIGGAQFDQPGASGSRVRIPISFVQQSR